MAEKQAEFYQEVSAKTNSNIEDLFNRTIDELQASTNKKKEQSAPNATNPSIVETESKGENKSSDGKVKLG